MASMENISVELELTELKKDILRKTLENLHSQSSSILLLTLQWKDLEDHFDSVQKSILQRSAELQTKEKHFDSVQRSIEERAKEVESKEKGLDLIRKSVEERSEEVELKEKGLGLIQKSIDERSEEVESREKKLELVQKTIQECVKEVKLKEEEFELFRRSVEERSQAVELKEKRLESVQKSIEERCKEVELEEKKCILFQRSVEERSEEVELKQKQLGSVQNSIEERSKELELTAKQVDSVQKSIEQRSKELEWKEKRLNAIKKSNDERRKEVESKEKEFDSVRKSIDKCSEELELKERRLDSIEKSNEVRCKEVESKEKRLGSIQTSIDKYSEELELKGKQLNSILKLSEERCKELESKEKQIDSVQKMIQECLKELESKEKHSDSIQKSIEKRSKELELKEKQIGSIQNSIKERSEELESKEKQLNLIQKTIDQCLKELDLKEKQFDSKQKSIEEHAKELESKEKRLTNILHSQVKTEQPELFLVDNAINSSSANLRFCITMDGRSLQLFLNKRPNEHESMRNEVSIALRMSSDPAKLVLDAMQGFYPPHSKEGDMEFKASVVRRSCILLLEQLMEVSPQIRPPVKEAAMKVAGEWKAKMRAEAENSLEVLGFLQLLATYGLAPAFDADELLHLLEIVRQNRHAPELRRVLGFAFAEMIPMIKTTPSQVEIKESVSENLQLNNTVASSSVSPEPKSFSVNMNRKSRKMLLNKRVKEHDPMHCEVSDFIQFASDPAKLVLDEMKQFYPLNLEGAKGFKLSATRSCIFMLEQLMRVSPQIKPHVKEEAMKFAVDWKVKLDEKIEDAWNVLGFLEILATYGLASSFDANELFGLLDIVHHRKQAPTLFRVLGLTDKIPNYIKNLVEKKQWLEAIRYTCEFEQDDKFPPIPLLKAHVKFCKRVTFKICRKKQNTCVARIQAADKEIAALRAALRCITDYNLGAKYWPKNLENRIVKLEKQKSNDKRLALTPSQKRRNKRPRTAVSAEAAPNSSVGTPSAACSIQPPSRQMAGSSADQGSPYTRTSAGHYNQGGSTLVSPHVNTLLGSYALAATTPVTWQYGSGIATNGGARHFGFAGNHFGVAPNLSAGQFGLAGTDNMYSSSRKP